MRDFSPLLILARLKIQIGVAIEVLQTRICDFILKVLARFTGLET